MCSSPEIPELLITNVFGILSVPYSPATEKGGLYEPRQWAGLVAGCLYPSLSPPLSLRRCCRWWPWGRTSSRGSTPCPRRPGASPSPSPSAPKPTAPDGPWVHIRPSPLATLDPNVGSLPQPLPKTPSAPDRRERGCIPTTEPRPGGRARRPHRRPEAERPGPAAADRWAAAPRGLRVRHLRPPQQRRAPSPSPRRIPPAFWRSIYIVEAPPRTFRVG